MNIINVTVRGKIARAEGRARVVCGNSDYAVRFDFDAEWEAYDLKTARFVSEDGSYTDVQFEGDDCAIPILRNTRTLLVGVFAGNLRTTTAALIHAVPCITDPDGTPADPTPDVYAQLMERFNAMEAPAAVLYTAQELTNEQKAQARANVGAMDQYRGLTPFVAGIRHPVYVEYGYLKPIPADASEEVVKAYTQISTCVYLFSPQKMGIPSPMSIGNEEGKGVMGRFLTLHDVGLIPDNLNLCSDVDKSARWIFEYSTKTGEAALTVVDNIGLRQARAVKKLSDGTYTYSGYNIAKLSYASDGKRLQLPQTELQADPTEDMHIATKKYVDEKAVGGGDTSLGLTSAAVGQLIKIKAVDADGKPTEWEAVDDRLPNVSSSDDGKVLAAGQISEFEYGYFLDHKPTLEDFIPLGITNASPGQFAKVSFVNEFGQPTSWEAVDMPSGGEQWEKIAEIDFDVDAANDVSAWEYQNLPNYKELAYRKVSLTGSTENSSGISISINGSQPHSSGIGYSKNGAQSNGWGKILLLPFGWIHVYSGSANSPTNYAAGGVQTTYNAIPFDGDSITSVRLTSHPIYKIAGGKLSLYGRK